MAICTYLSIITLNVSGLNAPKDIGWLIGCKKTKRDPSVCCLQETHFRAENTDWKWRDGRRCSMQMEMNKAGVAVLIRQRRL